ncbi:MAG: biotin transporter BioY [Anaeromicrobium sp.]|jgi:biotin transport system substrate-specific component|uniref:biotin transporter BioY n=1 Tax=Anaeromicrobium sp. TaxID=1929132 RepID=UPI0025F9F484|nr:biotin transporter BioY [Anaeromicrobium sp.]MCT4595738.1 biotin transporter BioY [Anaeromicrobium sp.]
MKTRELILVALFAALTAIGAFIQIPGPVVPFTLQYVFCAFAGILLGRRLGLYSQLLYVGIGLSGVPVFTKGGGPTYVLIPTFGYLLGFILCAIVIGFLIERQENYSFFNVLKCVLPGLGAVYMVGVPYLYVILKYYLSKPISFNNAMQFGFYPFIIQDIVLSCIVALVASRVIPSLKKAGYFKIHKKVA